MLDDVLEIVVEILLEGAAELAGSSKKAAAIGLAALAWLAVTVLLLWTGIAEKNTGLIILSAVLLAALGVWLYVKVRKYRRKERQAHKEKTHDPV